MLIQDITEKERNEYNAVVSHPLQSFEWGEFREATGVKVIRRGLFDPSAGHSTLRDESSGSDSKSSGQGRLVSGFQLTIHPIPHTPFTIGYLPKGDLPTGELLQELKKIGKEEKCIFIQLEPNVIRSKNQELRIKGLLSAAHPLFTKYNFVLDLEKSEEELLKNMHQKARYNIKVAKKYEVKVTEETDQRSFNEYLKLTEETTSRQGFFAHTLDYHRKMWQALSAQKTENRKQKTENKLTAHLLTAKYKGKVLTAWILFVFKDTLYYPYGASSSEDRKTMASSLMMWEAIRFGKSLGLKKFDMWGALGSDPDRNDPWYGFHSFKEKYGPEHVEYIGSYDLVINPLLYQAYKLADKLRWLVLRLRK